MFASSLRAATVATALAAAIFGAPLSAAAATTQPTAGPTVAPVVTTVTDPQPVQNQSWTKVSENSARLSWAAPANEPADTTVHYAVHVEFDAATKPYDVADTTATSVTVPNIAPGTSVQGYVQDKAQPVPDQQAASPKWTQPAIAPSKPTAVNITARDMNYAKQPPAARVVWQAPESDGGAEIKQYLVQLYAGPSGKKQQLVDSTTVSADTFSHTFGNLEFETYYLATVKATNAAGQSAGVSTDRVETVAEPQATPSATLPPSATTPSPAPTTDEPAPLPHVTTIAPRPTPSASSPAEPDMASLWFVALLPVIVLLLIAAVVALVVLETRFRRQRAADAATQQSAQTAAHTLNPIFKEPTDDDQDL